MSKEFTIDFSVLDEENSNVSTSKNEFSEKELDNKESNTNDNNQNVNKNVIYDEINTKIKQTITIIKEKNQELSVLLQ